MGTATLSLIVDAKWKAILEQSLGLWDGVSLHEWSAGENRPGVYFFDVSDPECEKKINSLERKAKAVFLIVQEKAAVPQLWVDGKVDDILVYPFRRLEALSKIRAYQQVLLWEEVTRINASFSQVIESLHDDLKLAERLQKAHLPQRFPEIKSVKLASRYLAGARPGGDYFEVIENKARGRLSMVLSDSSNYGLSSLVLAAIMQVSFKLAMEADLSCPEVIQAIAGNLGSALNETDQLSLFYGQWSKNDLRFRYVSLGGVFVYHARAEETYRLVPASGPALSGSSLQSWKTVQDAEIELEPMDRLVVASDGFVQLCGGVKEFERLLDRHRIKDPVDSLNEMTYQVKKDLKSADELPEQDCTAVMLEVPAHTLRLKKS